VFPSQNLLSLAGCSSRLVGSCGQLEALMSPTREPCLWELAATNQAARLEARLTATAADLNGQDQRGWTPLQVAALGNAGAAADVLLRFRADVNMTCGYLAPTALHLAAWHDHVNVAKVLLNHHADVNAANGAGETPLAKAQQRGQKRCSALLEQSSSSLPGHVCHGCKTIQLRGGLGTGSFEGLWYCEGCWNHWSGHGQQDEAPELPVMSWHEFNRRVKEGAKWLIIDGTIIDVSVLIQPGDTLHKGGGDVLTRSIGEDLTGYFIYYHANIPNIASLHKPGMTHMEHVRDKIVKNAVGVLDTHTQRPPLTSPHHRFWVESEEKTPFHEHSATSFAAQGLDVKTRLATVLQGLEPNSVETRAFWAIVGCLVADAAAQPTHWNYKLTYFHEDLKSHGRWSTPEFLRPSLNTYYHLQMGCNSCYGDQAKEVLYSLNDCRGLDPHRLEMRFVDRFAEDGDYGPLPSEGLYNGSKQDVRELPIKGPWRHISIAGFLKNIKRGRHYPNCGTDDAQADCFVRIVPVVALYAGHPDLLEKVAQAVRLTQNNPPAVAVAQAFATILEDIIITGSSGLTAIGKAIYSFSKPSNRSKLEGFFGRVADTMQTCAGLSGTSLYDAVLHFGKGAYSTSQVS